jgi:transcriptional regulator with XRE-family HTH domain
VRTGISQLRLDAGYTSAKSAAKALKISEIHLAKIESGASGAGEDLERRMAKLYGTTVSKVVREIKQARLAYHGRMLSS